MKKTIRLITVLTTLCALLFAGCTTEPSLPDNSPTSTQSVSANSPNPVTINSVLSLQTEGYKNLPLKEFNTTVKETIDTNAGFLSDFSELLDSVTQDDSEYSFICETLNYSINEVISSQMGQPITFSRYLKEFGDEYTTESGETFFNFMFTTLYSAEYRIVDEAGLTVQERDELLAMFQTELQNAVSKMDREQLTANDIKMELQNIADSLCTKLSTNVFVFENVEIQSIEVHDGGQEYQR